jgi:hypothetical protein
MEQAVAYLSADVLAVTGASESYLAFLVRSGVVRPFKHRNGKTNLFTQTDIDRVHWAMEHRGRLSVGAERATRADEVPA